MASRVPSASGSAAAPSDPLLGTRVVVLAWCLWLLGSWAGTLWIEPRPYPSPAAGRLMVMLALLWLLVLWPAARLSQGVEHESRGLRGVGVIAVDWLSMLLLLQAVVWALGLMAGWGWRQTMLVDAAVAGWSAWSAAAVAGGRAVRRGWARSAAMGVCVVLAMHELPLIAMGVELHRWPGPVGATMALSVPSERFEPTRWWVWVERAGLVWSGACAGVGGGGGGGRARRQAAAYGGGGSGALRWCVVPVASAGA